jgi:tRNA1(Val) A37 N6-methylase TrmN6
MSIKTTILADFLQDFTVTKADKMQYGEIYSPFSLIRNMFGLFAPQVFTNKATKWLDTGAGTGYFSMVLFDLLNTGLASTIVDPAERHSHIIENMLYLIELKPSNVAILHDRFGPQANIINADFLSYQPDLKFDYIIGNPPYNAHGCKKVPTNKISQKKADGRTVWMLFLKQALRLLTPHTGQLCYIVPSLWMKPDKAGLYNLLTQYKLEKIHCLSNTETNKLFKGEAQTPTCYFLLSNIQSAHTQSAHIQSAHTQSAHTQSAHIHIYDKHCQTYVKYAYTPGTPLPLFGQNIVKKLQPYLIKAGGPLKVIKTNMPSKHAVLSNTYDALHFPYANITTCLLQGLQPTLVVNYSSTPQAYHNQPKLILAHKMYGFPYFDITGTYGITNRDNYVLLLKDGDKTLADLTKIQAFLSTKFALYIYEATRYRMKYLEKYAFELLPDITKLADFPVVINDKTIAVYFGLSAEDEYHILNHSKTYGTL